MICLSRAMHTVKAHSRENLPFSWCTLWACIMACTADYGSKYRYPRIRLSQISNFTHKKCTDCKNPCTNGHYSGSIISVTKTPASFFRLIKPSYFSTMRLIRFRPCPWLPRLFVMYSSSSLRTVSFVALLTEM